MAPVIIDAQHYVLLTNLAKLRIAAEVLRDVQPQEQYLATTLREVLRGLNEAVTQTEAVVSDLVR